MNRTIGMRRGETDLVSLSPQEIEVARLVARNKRPREIAEAMDLGPPSVRTYIFRLCQGLGLKGRTELLLWGLQNPQALDGKPARAGLHPIGCRCGSPVCDVWLDRAA